MNLGSLENLEGIWQVLGSFRKYSGGFLRGYVALGAHLQGGLAGRAFHSKHPGVLATSQKLCLALLMEPKVGGRGGSWAWLQQSHGQSSSHTSVWLKAMVLIHVSYFPGEYLNLEIAEYSVCLFSDAIVSPSLVSVATEA